MKGFEPNTTSQECINKYRLQSINNQCEYKLDRLKLLEMLCIDSSICDTSSSICYNVNCKEIKLVYPFKQNKQWRRVFSLEPIQWAVVYGIIDQQKRGTSILRSLKYAFYKKHHFLLTDKTSFSGVFSAVPN